jgi:hypothetical protein
MHNAQCTMHNAQCTMHNAQCTMHNAQCTMLHNRRVHKASTDREISRVERSRLEHEAIRHDEVDEAEEHHGACVGDHDRDMKPRHERQGERDVARERDEA